MDEDFHHESGHTGHPAGRFGRVCDLAASTTSEHLRILKEAGLIVSEIERPRVCYSLNPMALKPLAAFLDRATAGLTPRERV